ncbi:MAG: 2-oxoacid:acceptor oxidoreductase family protein [Deltaproteobacteria bacterium]|nr:2-oxoacid:acceptor oxidoreductase family protein [Deltaproteobacteria bacterium]MBW2051040.1 2-oxoacid:acceptor oxidoreductase family protein [Deltaproteobacteria bacterium]MBW2140711.1 2-oxoacid:acceptor oxidoreductase family protein [Deltaproteobacteria bacterium]MBW2323137.1 2-oxoacid:acceptor oxidoreductase family protein [Deltaproteobacteria bacterium]
MAASKEKEIVITGFGGQGIILTGNILGKAAVINDNKHAIMIQSYGPEARGGACSSQVIISDEEILSPSVEEPQVLICMNQEGYDKNVESLVPKGLLVWDTDLVETSELDPSWTTYHIPSTRFAEEMGNKMMANIVMLGFLSSISELVSVESLKKAVLSSVPPRTKDNNSKAFDRGREYGEAILKSRSKQDKNRGQA